MANGDSVDLLPEQERRSVSIWWVLLLIAVVIAVVAIARNHQSGLTIDATQESSKLGSDSVTSCVVNGSNVSVSGVFQDTAGEAPVAGLVSIQIVGGSGAVVGSDTQIAGPPLITSGSAKWTVSVPFTGQPSACNVKTVVLPPPGFLP
jgi:hypothetical protein